MTKIIIAIIAILLLIFIYIFTFAMCKAAKTGDITIADIMDAKMRREAEELEEDPKSEE